MTPPWMRWSSWRPRWRRSPSAVRAAVACAVAVAVVLPPQTPMAARRRPARPGSASAERGRGSLQLAACSSRRRSTAARCSTA
eukprot:359842-Chlamydomonas_euryale.AAC.1